MEEITLVPKKYSMKKYMYQSKERELVFRHGHIAITNYKLGDNREFEKSLSVFDKVNWKYIMKGGYYVKELREFRINRGYDTRKLSQFFPGVPARVENDPYPSDEIDIELYAPPRDDFQRVALTFMAGQGNYNGNLRFTQQLINMDTGAGKAQPDDIVIPTPSGIKRFGDLKVGNEVFTPEGKPTAILAIFPQPGLQKTYEVTLEDGRSTRCNPDHLWNVIDRVDGAAKTILLSTIIEDYHNSDGFRYSIKLPNAMEYDNHEGQLSIRSRVNLVKWDIRSYGGKVLDGALHLHLVESRIEYLTSMVRSLGGVVFDKGLCEDGTHLLIIYSKYLGTEAKDSLEIRNIREVEPCRQRCILVDDDAHMYITENYIPTHNTYCGVSIGCFMHARTVVIMPFSKLLEQWRDSYLTFTSLTKDEIMIVQGSKACMKILEGKCKHVKAFLFMADTIVSFQETYGNLMTIDMLHATNAHIKIVDEIHRDMKAIAMLEALSNFKMNYYMSATPGRSDKKENWIFKTLFMNVPRFGADFKTKYEKHINIMIKQYVFAPDHKQTNKMINRRNGWLNSKSYEKVMITAPDYQRENFEKAFLEMLEWSKRMVKPEYKILILMSTIDGTEYAQGLAERVFPGETSRYYGTMGKKDVKEEALSKRIICATTSSLGTGADIKGLQHVYNCATYSNWVDAGQLPGRARNLNDPDAPVVYIELVNMGYNKTLKQFYARKDYLINKSRSGKLMMIE